MAKEEKEVTLESLKSQAYDTARQVQAMQFRLQEINQQILALENNSKS